jgi:hypothetical protein
MITKEKIKEYFEQEIENHGKLIYLLYRDKKLLKEERFEDFATELLERAKKAYWGSLAMAIMFFLLGSIYLFDSSFLGSYNVQIGFIFITVYLIATILSTKEYYSIKGSMTMLLKLLEPGAKTQITPQLETA